MGEINKEAVTRRLATVIDPHTDSDLVDGKSVTEISVDGVDVKVRLTLGYAAKTWHRVLKEQVTAAWLISTGSATSPLTLIPMWSPMRCKKG